MRNILRKIGQFLTISGPVVGISPFVVSIATYSFASDFGNAYHWLTLFTLPLGLGVGALGILIFFVSYIFPKTTERDENLSSLVAGVGSMVLVVCLPLTIFVWEAIINSEALKPSCVIKTDKLVYYPGEEIFVTWTTKHTEAVSIQPSLMLGESLISGSEDTMPLSGSQAVSRVWEDFGKNKDYLRVDNPDGSWKFVDTGKFTFDPALEKKDTITMFLKKGGDQGSCMTEEITIKAAR